MAVAVKPLSSSTNGRVSFGVSTTVTSELLELAEERRTILAKGTWQSYGSEQEIMEENAANVPRRSAIKMQLEVPRKVLLRHRTSAHSTYVTKEASEDSRDLRGVIHPNYEVVREEVDVGVQAVTVCKEANSQTHVARKVNAIVQAEPVIVDACIRHISVPLQESPALSAFLAKSLPRVLHCLTQNYEIPIYDDDYSLFKDDDAIVGRARDDTALTEKGNYIHTITKDKRVTSISWRSGKIRDDFICISCITPCSLEERIDKQRQCESSLNLVWQLSDPMHPRFILEAPNEVQVLRFNPIRPNMIAGGSMNGQVYLWNLDAAANAPLTTVTDHVGSPVNVKEALVGNLEDHDVGEIPPLPDSIKGVSAEKDGDVWVPKLQPYQSSRVELSHKRPIHDLQWLPNGLECTFDGRQIVTDEGRQFATISDDGSMCIWDIRPDYLPPDKLRKMKHQIKGPAGSVEVPWVPLLKYQLSKPDGEGDIMAMRFHFDGLASDDLPSYNVACGGTDGELATCCMVTRHERRSSGMVATFGNSKDSRFVRHVVKAHAGPIYCVQRNPFIGDIYLTCGDHSFKVWRAGQAIPLHISPRLDSPVTCAAWSPTRPAVVFIGTASGKVLVWDLLDRNSEPLIIHHLVQDAVTTISFKSLPPSSMLRKSSSLPQTYLQQVVIGTNLGSFHWYFLPRALSRTPNGERRLFRSILTREARRAAYYSWRWEERHKEIDRYGVHSPKMLSWDGDHTHRAEDVEEIEKDGDILLEPKKMAHTPNMYDKDDTRDSEFLAKVEELRKAEEIRMKNESV